MDVDYTLLQTKVVETAGYIVAANAAWGDADTIDRLAENLRRSGPGIQGKEFHSRLIDVLRGRAVEVREARAAANRPPPPIDPSITRADIDLMQMDAPRAIYAYPEDTRRFSRLKDLEAKGCVYLSETGATPEPGNEYVAGLPSGFKGSELHVWYLGRKGWRAIGKEGWADTLLFDLQIAVNTGEVELEELLPFARDDASGS